VAETILLTTPAGLRIVGKDGYIIEQDKEGRVTILRVHRPKKCSAHAVLRGPPPLVPKGLKGA
jgi:hypothetical protein